MDIVTGTAIAVYLTPAQANYLGSINAGIYFICAVLVIVLLYGLFKVLKAFVGIFF